jgi:hypothetical protein
VALEQHLLLVLYLLLAVALVVVIMVQDLQEVLVAEAHNLAQQELLHNQVDQEIQVHMVLVITEPQAAEVMITVVAAVEHKLQEILQVAQVALAEVVKLLQEDFQLTLLLYLVAAVALNTPVTAVAAAAAVEAQAETAGPELDKTVKLTLAVVQVEEQSQVAVVVVALVELL